MNIVKTPNIKSLKTYKCGLKPFYGILIKPDEFETVDKASNLVVSFESLNKPSAGTFRGLSGVIVAIADDFRSDFIGGEVIKVGDRILTNSNKTAIVYDKDIRLLQLREPDILAKIDNNIEIKL